VALRNAKCHPACCKALLWSRLYILCAPQRGRKAPRVVGKFSDTSVRRDTLLTLCRSVLKLRRLMETDFSTQKRCEVCTCPRNTQIFTFYVTQNTLRSHCKNRSVNSVWVNNRSEQTFRKRIVPQFSGVYYSEKYHYRTNYAMTRCYIRTDVKTWKLASNGLISSSTSVAKVIMFLVSNHLCANELLYRDTSARLNQVDETSLQNIYCFMLENEGTEKAVT
jgi:hypothetical protein